MSADTKEPEQEEAGDPWAEALAEQANATGDATAKEEVEAPEAAPKKAEPDFEKAAFGQLEDVTGEMGARDVELGGDMNLDVILDVPVSISMEIGRTHLPIRNLLRLNQGSVVELDRLAGEPLDVLVNGTLIAHGEVVVVNEKYGIRLTDVISPAERVRKLR
ncbi:flagellar motor switch protein FliN [Acidihalobacter yilgarnensis]|uniref:Flagellar motor switch protein FliN n=1 Tax=Acidihalobacter yilgarnensis TaxID=2819280 RepID=A0A1D8IPS9_9GAMM|nr:flagellar motor switch protein FliN [Acidihalobacter yilgarnensis]AOU98461.1 flagellar motor switch protein FliN [Acidihalobacter yilgarnensis]